MKQVRAIAVALAAVLCLGAAAADPAERLADPVKEARARHLFRQVRCLVCQNESIDDSEAPLADDLRHVVREQILAGRSDAEIKAFLTDRYGEFVLFKPRFSPGNAVLWLTPFAIVGLGGMALVVFRRRGGVLDPPLSEDEEERLRGLAHSGGAITVPPQDGPIGGRIGGPGL
jgi:cytochrome c-type biogenesis protein CcmH